MKKFMDIFKRKNRLTDEKSWNPSLWNLYGSKANSGEFIDEHSALHYSAVFNAISLISGSISALPLNLFRKIGNKKEIVLSRVRNLLHDSPNPYMSAMNFRETLIAHVLAWGNCYAEKVFNVAGNIIELWPIQPDRVAPKLENGEIIYIVNVEGKQIRLSRNQILHIPGLGFDGFVGYSVVSMARQSIGLGKAMESFGSLYFGQGTHPGVIVSHPGKLSENAHKNLKDSLISAHSGLGKSHRLMLLEEGMKIDRIAIPPADSQFIEGRQFQIPEIARWFNIPPHKLKDLTKSSFSNIESEQISYVTDSLLPWAIRFEQNLNMQLLNAQDRAKGLYFKHNFEGLLRGNASDRAEFYRKMFNIGAMSINEIRAKEDLDPIVGGDIHLVPVNMTTIDNIGQNTNTNMIKEKNIEIKNEFKSENHE